MAQVGVRTRARTLAAAAAAAAAAATGASRKRKVNNRELMMSASYIQLRTSSRRRVLITPENSVSISLSPEINPDPRTVIQDRCSSPSSDHASASCCSSYGSSDQRVNKLADLEVKFEIFGLQIIKFNCAFMNSTWIIGLFRFNCFPSFQLLSGFLKISFYPLFAGSDCERWSWNVGVF